MAATQDLITWLFTLALIAIVHTHEVVNPLTNEHVHEHPAEQHQQQQGAEHSAPQGAEHSAPHDHSQPHNIMDKNVVQDQEHIMEHLDGKIQKPIDAMSEEELQFHYFKVHDYDDNNMLDGIELIAALTHHHAENNKDKLDSTPRQSDSELSQMVDDILRDNDPNGDGFIDYAEFLAVQRAQATDGADLEV